MRIIKQLSFLLAGLVLILVLAFWGFKQNFPGESIANTLQVILTTRTGIPFEIQKIEMGWSKISTPGIVLRTPKWMPGIPDIRMLILEKLEVPFSTIITSGNANLSGQIHDGALHISTELVRQKALKLSITRLNIERTPLFSLIPYTSVSGLLSLSTHIENFFALQQKKAKFPEGNIKGKLINTYIRFSEGTAFMPLKLPEFNLSEVMFDVQLGQRIQIKKIKFQGSLEGIIDGNIKLNEKHPKMSLIDLNIQVKLSPAFKKGLGSAKLFLGSFQCGEIIKINLKGTLNRINYPTRMKC